MPDLAFCLGDTSRSWAGLGIDWFL